MMKIFMGYDPREAIAAAVCARSILNHSPGVQMNYLVLSELERTFTREFRYEDRPDGTRQMFDVLTGAPCSTEFSFTRFLVPYLMQYRGVAVFLEPDMLLTTDIRQLLDFPMDDYAVRVVKHNHKPVVAEKMDHQMQTTYPRKNWSSFVVWNCAHPAHRLITPGVINRALGMWLHAFGWLDDYIIDRYDGEAVYDGETLIGDLPETWNWLAGISPTTDDRSICSISTSPHTGRRQKQYTRIPANIHFTEGGPWFLEYQDVEFAEAWLNVVRGG